MAKANAAARALDRIKAERPGRPDYPYAEVAHGRFRPGGGEPGERPRGGSVRGSATALRPPRRVLSLGQNGRWRRVLVRHLARSQPRRVLDVATGTAGVAIALARATDADIVGVDISEPMLERRSQARVRRRTRSEDQLQRGRAEELPFPERSFDAVSFTYLLRYVADPAATLVELVRVLRPGGGMASLDFHVPPNPMWRASWRLYTRALMPSAGYALGGHAWWNAGRFLGPTSRSSFAGGRGTGSTRRGAKPGW